MNWHRSGVASGMQEQAAVRGLPADGRKDQSIGGNTMNYRHLIAITLGFAAPLALAQQAGGAATAPNEPQQYKTAKLNRSQVDALLAKPGELLILDVRRPDELTKIGGFPAYLSIQTAEVDKYAAYIPKDRRVLTVSNHAVRAQRTGDLLEAKGFKVAGAVGVQDYEAEGGTLAKVAPPPPRPADSTPAR